MTKIILLFNKLMSFFQKKRIPSNAINKTSIDFMNIPLDKKLDSFSLDEVEMIKDSMTIDCTEEFIAARKKYIEPYKESLYNYPEIKSLDENTRENLLNDIYYNMENGGKKNFKSININEKYSIIDGEILSYIQLYEHGRFAFLMKRYKNEVMNIFWYLWRSAPSCKINSTHNKLDKVLIYYDNPPSPEILNGEVNGNYYHAGVLPYCHCWAQPILDIRDIFNQRKYVKVFWDNKIHKFTEVELKNFIVEKKLKNIPEIIINSKIK